MVTGRYFPPGSAKFLAARAHIGEGRIFRIESESGEKLAEASFRAVSVSARLGNVARRFRLPDGGLFETHDNDAVDDMLRGVRRGSDLVHRLERSLQWVIGAFAVAGVALYAFVQYGIPASAAWLASETPQSMMDIVSEKTLSTLDSIALNPSKLSPANRRKAQSEFAEIAALGARGAHGYHLEFRNAPALGPNAFALPNGTIVMTDELWPYVKDDDGLEGVFAHEIAHVDRRHGMQSVYQAAIVPAAIALVAGDPSQVTHFATIMPGILMQSAYSRHFEQQADDDAAAKLVRLGKDPGALAALLQRLENAHCGKDGCGPSWLGSHPMTADRVARLLSERAPARKN